MTEEEIKTFVIDNGSSMCKVGLSGEAYPRSSFPTIVGRLKYENTIVNPIYQKIMIDTNTKDFFVGE
jgi:actin-related protein